MTISPEGVYDLEPQLEESSQFAEVAGMPSDQLEEVDVIESDEPNRPPGPGLPETVGWIGLFYLFQFAAMIVVIGVAMALTGANPARFNMEDWLAQIGPVAKSLVLFLPAFLCYVGLIPLGLFRLSPSPLRQLNFSLPTMGQVSIIASLVLPMTFLTGYTMEALMPLWEQIEHLVPFGEALSQNNVHDYFNGLDQIPFLLALFLIAVVPAVGEEFVFRGLLGRGLVARWGLFGGVTLTTLFFAAVHMFPPHVIALLPLAFAIHVVYLTTKSFWAPVILHFLNNGLAVIFLQAGIDEEGETSIGLLIFAAVYFFWCMYWLYKMRTSYQQNGETITTPHNAVAAPVGTNIRRVTITYLVPTIIAVVLIIAEIYMVADALL